MKGVFLRWGGIAAALLAGLLLFTRAPHGIATLRQRHEQIRELQRENAELQKEIAEKRERIRKLSASPSEQELEIRKRLKLQRPGETAIILGDQPGNKPAK
jgi:cell division protein FtsB